MSLASLAQLCLNEADQDRGEVKFLNNVQTSWIEIMKFEDNKYVLYTSDRQRFYDLFTPMFIVSDNKIDYLEIRVGSELLNKYPLEFTNKIFKTDKNYTREYDNKFVYNIHYE